MRVCASQAMVSDASAVDSGGAYSDIVGGRAGTMGWLASKETSSDDTCEAPAGGDEGPSRGEGGEAVVASA